MDAPTPGQLQPGHRIFLGTWQPAPGSVYAIVQIHGPEEGVTRMVEQIGRTTDVVLHIDASASMPPDAWDRLPLRFLSPTQQAIVCEDLRGTKRDLMARTLHISRHTITVYRTTIRKKFLGIPPEERPIWMEIWLRRFPGIQYAPVQRPTDAKGRK